MSGLSAPGRISWMDGRPQAGGAEVSSTSELSCLSFLSGYIPPGLQSPARDQIHSLSRPDRRFRTFSKQSAAVSLSLHLHGLGEMEQYQDALFNGAFHMQLPVDSIASNKDTWLSLRSLCSSVVIFFQVV